MEYQVQTMPEGAYLETSAVLNREADALSLIEACAESDVTRVLLRGDNVAEAFFDLKSGLAGQILLKLSMYRVKTALLLTEQQVGSGKFYEMVLETNRGNQFRVFSEREAAVAWLLA